MDPGAEAGTTVEMSCHAEKDSRVGGVPICDSPAWSDTVKKLAPSQPKAIML